MRVSVIIPVFNDEAGVYTCLAGVKNQRYSVNNVEVVVVDNGSEPVISVNQIYPFHLRVIRCAIPGSYAARNAGAREASGDVFVFTDADCWPDPDWLAHGIAALWADGEKFVVGGAVSIVKPSRPTAVALYQYTTGFGQESNLRDKGFSTTANLFCTRTQFEKVGPFDERLLSGGDREWSWRAAKYGIGVRFEPGAVTYTQPRTSLRAAIRQARRAVAGRAALRKLGLAHRGDAAVAKRRSDWQAFAWILSNRNLRKWDRLRVLWVAALIRAACVMEAYRLALGGNAERR